MLFWRTSKKLRAIQKEPSYIAVPSNAGKTDIALVAAWIQAGMPE